MFDLQQMFVYLKGRKKKRSCSYSSLARKAILVSATAEDAVKLLS